MRNKRIGNRKNYDKIELLVRRIKSRVVKESSDGTLLYTGYYIIKLQKI